MPIKWEDRFEQFDGLGETQLLHLARNEAVPVENRLLMVEILLKKGYQSVKHIDLKGMVEQLDIPIPPEKDPETVSLGAPSASVTTLTMAQDTVQIMDKITACERGPDF